MYFPFEVFEGNIFELRPFVIHNITLAEDVTTSEFLEEVVTAVK